MNFFKKNIALITLIVTTVLFAVIPVVETRVQTGSSWRGVLPEYTNDTLYYLSRMQNVARGSFLIPNPYIAEYQQAVSPSFFVADWLSAIPLLMGFSLSVAFTLNLIVWGVIFVLLCYLVFRQLEISKNLSVLFSLLTYLQIYWLMLRPTAMQTIFPFYILFLLAYVLWIKSSKDNKRITFLVISSTFTFYIYTYLWQIVAITFFLTHLYLLIQKDFTRFKTLFLVNIVVGMLSLPVVWYSWIQIHSPNYWDSMARIGLVLTRLPTLDFINYGRWIVLVLLLGLFVRSWLPPKFVLFGGLTGITLLIASWSNLVLGKELETANHIGRFIMVWFSICFLALLTYLWQHKQKLQNEKIWKKVVIGLLVLICLLGFIRTYYYRSIPFANIAHSDFVPIQSFEVPLSWLDTNVTAESVVWVPNEEVGQYMPILTREFVLFHPAAGLQIMPSFEVEERYLVSHSLEYLTKEKIKEDFRKYAGVGNAIHQANTINRPAEVCLLVKKVWTTLSCPPFVDSYSIRGEMYFQNMFERFVYIQKHTQKFLNMYNVEYILLDKNTDDVKSFAKLSTYKIVWSNERFIILEKNDRKI